VFHAQDYKMNKRPEGSRGAKKKKWKGLTNFDGTRPEGGLVKI